MQPSLIKTKKSTEVKVIAWKNGIKKTGILRTSAIPCLDTVLSGNDDKAEEAILIESIEFNSHIESRKIQQLVQCGYFKLAKTLANLDFMNQRINIELLESLLPWLSDASVTIKHCNLASLSVCSKAWRYWVDYLIKSNIKIQSLELGKIKTNLSRVKDIVNILHECGIGVQRLGLAGSQWTFCEMKAFLWMGGLSRSKQLTRFSLGDSVLCANSKRLLIEHLSQAKSHIQIFSSGIVDLGEADMIKLFKSMQTRQSSLLSVVISNQTLSRAGTEQLARVIGQSETLQHLAVINCWLEKDILAEKVKSAKVPNLYIEAITAGQIQVMTEILMAKGYDIEREISRHRVKFKLCSEHKS